MGLQRCLSDRGKLSERSLRFEFAGSGGAMIVPGGSFGSDAWD